MIYKSFAVSKICAIKLLGAQSFRRNKGTLFDKDSNYISCFVIFVIDVDLAPAE